MDISSLLKKIDVQKKRLDVLRQTLDNNTIREALKVEFLYESNRIEGNSLTLRETQLVINEGITVSGKSLREHLEAINHNEAIEFVQDIVAQKIPFSEYILKQIHGLVLHGIDRENAGRYRQVPVMIAGSKHLPPQPYLLQSLMERYFDFYETHKNSLHPVVLSAEMHERLVTIHPFIDGNGRTSRLIMSLILLQYGFPLATISGDYESRMSYYEALEKRQNQENNAAFVFYIADKVLGNIEKYLNILDRR